MAEKKKKQTRASDAQKKSSDPHFFISPMRDVAFRKLFGKDAPDFVAIAFLNQILELPDNAKIQSIIKMDGYTPGEFGDQPFCVQDLQCKDQNGQTYLVEVQVLSQDYFEKRLLFYFSRLYKNQLKAKASYDELKKVFVIAIVGYDMFPNLQTYKHQAFIKLDENNQQIMSDFQTTIIELKKFAKSADECKTPLDHWLYFLKQSEALEDVPDHVTDPAIIKAYDIIDSYNWGPKEQLIAEAIQKRIMDNENIKRTLERVSREEGLAEGIVEGEKKGKAEAMREMAIKMLKRNISIEIIAEDTGLSLEEIAKLKS